MNSTGLEYVLDGTRNIDEYPWNGFCRDCKTLSFSV